MRIVVAAFSETGNTRQVAEAIAGAAADQGHAVLQMEIEELSLSELRSCDLLFLGSTCHSADLAAPVRAILERLSMGEPPCLAGFVTHSTWTPSEDPIKQELYERWAGKCQPTFERACHDRGVRFLGYFSCMGKPNPGIEQFIKNTIITDERQWSEYRSNAGEHPDEHDLANARAFSLRMLNLLD